MSDIFVSYSRKDEEFAKRLHRELINKSKDIWIDFQDIPKGEDFLQEIFSGIEKADIFCVIISRHSLISKICNQEIAHAIKTGKRILPVIREKIEGDVEKIVKGHWHDLDWAEMARANWDALKQKQWTFFDDESLFDSEFQRLIADAEKDIQHVKKHTRLLIRAIEWDVEQQRHESWLLFGKEINNWEKWLDTWDNLPDSKKSSPVPTDLQREYIRLSRNAEDKRQAVYQEYSSINDRVRKILSEAEQDKRQILLWVEEKQDEIEKSNIWLEERKTEHEKSNIWLEEQKAELEKKQKVAQDEFEKHKTWMEERKAELEKQVLEDGKRREELIKWIEEQQKKAKDAELKYQNIIKSSKHTRYLSRQLFRLSMVLFILNLIILLWIVYRYINL